MREATPPFREPHGVSTGASRDADAWRGELLRSVTIIVAAAAFLSLAGAFGTQAASLGVRFGFWTGLLALGTGANRLAQAALRGRVAAARRPLLAAVATSLAVSLPLTPMAVAMIALVFGAQPGGWGLWLYVFLTSLVISAAVSTLHVLAERRAPAATHAAVPGAAPPAFLKRFPPKLRGASLHAVEAQDHYLRLHTSLGSDLILMRMADALEELEGLEGARTHRSWWVARQAVQGVRREGARTVLLLGNGTEAPASRTYLPMLREDGWI